MLPDQIAQRTAQSVIENEHMTFAQWLVVAVTVALNALDGFDVLSISFAGPSLARDWGIDQATLGWVLSVELIGMGVGSLALGTLGDKVGRRSVILTCLIAMMLGMFGAGRATGIDSLLAWRLLTGFGIGGMLAITTAVTAEFSNQRWRGLAMSLMVIGYPVGGIVGGLAVQHILATDTWHSIFTLGGWAAAALSVVVIAVVPESPMFIDRRGGPNALARINRTLARLGHEPATGLTISSSVTRKAPILDIFKSDQLKTTLLVTGAYFALIISFYFLIKWVPKLVVDMGFEPAEAAGILMWLNAGGATGGVIFGVLATRFQLRTLSMIFLVGAAVAISWFGNGATNLGSLAIVVALAGFFTNSAICGMYALFAQVFPIALRSTGTGFALSVGRTGAVLAPVGAGYLFQAGFSLQTVAVIMGLGALLAALLLFFLRGARSRVGD